MIEVYALLFGTFVLSVVYSTCRKPVKINELDRGNVKFFKDSVPSQLLFAIILIIFVLFAGLRTVCNDTALYIMNFNRITPGLSSIESVNFSLGANPFFMIYQILFKTFISSGSSSFVFVTSLFVITSYLFFFRKYAPDFAMAIFIFIALGVFNFSMAAMKQTISMAIAVWALPLWIKGRRISSVLLIAFAAFFHPYIVILAVGFIFTKKIWDKKIVIMLLLTLIVVVFYSYFIEVIIGLTAAIGEEYSPDDMVSGEGVKLFRVIVYAVPVFLSFIYRDNIRKVNSRILNLAVNFSILSFCIMIIARIGNPITITRLAAYLDIFEPIAFAGIIKYGVKEKNNVKIISWLAIALFSVFYYFIYSKIGTSLTECFFDHIDIFDLIKGW